MQYMNFSWVLDNVVAGAQGPAGMRDLFFLYEQGVRAVIRMEQRTIAADSGGMVGLTDMFEPVPDFTPPAQEQIDRMLEFIEAQTEAGRPVAVSCYAGIGRTGTVLACYLVSKGVSPGDAVNEVRRLRPGSIQTPEQEAAVYQYAERRRSPTPLDIPAQVLAEVYREARRAFPFECCGWLSGPADSPTVNAVRICQNAQNSGTHPTHAARGAETAYVITGDDLLSLNHSLDSETPAKIIFHSHPNGRAYFSPTDREVAASPWGDGPAYPVQQLVVGITETRVEGAALFAWSDKEGGFAQIAAYEGEAI